MKLILFLTVGTILLTKINSKSVSGYQGGSINHSNIPKSEYVASNSLNSPDNSFNRNKYMKNTYKNVIKRDVPQSDPSQEPGSEPTTTEVSYPGYHSSQHVMVIPPRSAQRKQRAIENYGTQNEIEVPDVKIRNDTFGENAYENVLTSLYIWELLRNLKQTDNYNLFHYFNRPDDLRQEVVIPAAKIDHCQGTNSSFCLEGHMPICTRDDVVYCVVKWDMAVDCSSKYSQMTCAKTEVPCMDAEGDNSSCTETILIPCMQKVSVDMHMIGVNIRYCGVTYSTRKDQRNKANFGKGSWEQTLNKF